MALPQCQLITGDGRVSSELEAFVQATGLSTWGDDYQVVAIMGPQSSGKSTLLNSLFGTRFVEMDALSGRGQTTQGVWAAQGAADPGAVKTLVFDLEVRNTCVDRNTRCSHGHPAPACAC
jgi:protein SEY1